MKRAGMAIWLAMAVGCSQNGDETTAHVVPVPPDFGQVTNAALTDAVETARAAIETNFASPEAWADLGHVYQAHEWPGSAALCYGHATELDPKNYRWYYYLGRSLQQSDPLSALDALSQATTLNEAYAPAHLHLARVFRSLKEFDSAKKELERVEQLEPGNSFSMLGLGELALASGNIEVARRYLEDALSRNPDQSAVHAALAKVHMAMGDKRRARDHATAAGKPSNHKAISDPLWRQVEMAGVTPKWLIYQGRLALREGNYATATERFERAVSQNERDPRIWLDFGASLLGNSDYRGAIENLEKALNLLEDSDNDSPVLAGDQAMLLNNLGLAHENLGQLVLAETYFEAAIETSPEDSVHQSIATNNLLAFLVRTGAEYEKANELDKAEAYFARGVELSPRSALLLNNLAVVYRRQGRREEALTLVRRSLEVNEDPRVRRMYEILSRETNTPKS